VVLANNSLYAGNGAGSTYRLAVDRLWWNL